MRMRCVMMIALCFCVSLASAQAEVVIDGASASQWTPLPQWVAAVQAEEYAVRNEQGVLVFSAQGAGKEMPWLLRLGDLGISGDERYLVIRYRAEGFRAVDGYLLHGQEGTPGGRAYIPASDVEPDGQWHTLAADLVAIDPLESTQNIVMKVIVDDTAQARLEIESIRFTNILPEGAKVARVIGRTDYEETVVPMSAEAFQPRPGWTATATEQFASRQTADGILFSVSEINRGMRWLASLPEPIDTRRLPWLSLRYRALGQLGRATYTVWLGQDEGGAVGQRIAAVAPSDLQIDGAWHTLSLKVGSTFEVSQIAIGLDAAGHEVEMEIGDMRFSSTERRFGLRAVLDYDVRHEPWPAGRDGFTTAAVEVEGAAPSAFLLNRLKLADWFDAPHITVSGVPFTVTTDFMQVPQTSTVGLETLRIALQPDVREVWLLTANTAPSTEPWGIDPKSPRPQISLDVPEKVVYEIEYTQGPADFVMPLDAHSSQWGMKRGIGVNVVHPDPQREPVALVLHDRMQTAAFAFVGVTMNTGQPRISAPSWEHLRYSVPPTAALADVPAAVGGEGIVAGGRLAARWHTGAGGLSWESLAVPGLPGALAVASGPVFEVLVENNLLAPADWQVREVRPEGGGMVYRLHHEATQLSAELSLQPGEGDELVLRMTLSNEGPQMTTATLRFPVLQGLVLGGDAEQTWYLSGKRGGIINNAEYRTRDPLGERHPLQMDGFFNPQSGLALACLTRDTVAQHHFILLGKDDAGGDWACEYVQRDLAPGASFVTTEAALTLREGDWRAIFNTYRDWLATWFEPAVPRLEWFNKSFAVAAANVHYQMGWPPERRGAIEPLVDVMREYIGHCDWINLFGWGASEQYGGWGDYANYEELGGLDYFRGNIQDMLQQGVDVSLYLDGYLNSEQSRVSGEFAREWAMIRRDGSPQYIPDYDSYNQCPYLEPWQDHLSATYARVKQDLGARILYIDEFGSTDGRWTCYSREHGHNGYEIPYAGEVQMMRRIREAVGDDVALYLEYTPAEVSRRYVDGSISYQALWSVDEEPLAPHFVSLSRFAFPDFKQFHITYYVGTRAGNWWVNKFPFFNGEVHRVGVPNLPHMDEASREFLRHCITIQVAHRDTFASDRVQPLVDTDHHDVFANLFMGDSENVWTLYNAGGRGIRTPVLRVPHVNGAVYEDLWNERVVTPEIVGDEALIAVEIGPKGLGCVVQRLPENR